MLLSVFFFFFFNDTATTEIYTLSLHDALPICWRRGPRRPRGQIRCQQKGDWCCADARERHELFRSEEHTSELQSQSNLVCRLLLEKKKKNKYLNSLIPTHIIHATSSISHEPVA